MTLATLLGMLSTKLVNTDIGNLFHSLASQANSLFFVFGLLSGTFGPRLTKGS